MTLAHEEMEIHRNGRRGRGPAGIAVLEVCSSTDWQPLYRKPVVVPAWHLI
jgi:hypothetical protein